MPPARTAAKDAEAAEDAEDTERPGRRQHCFVNVLHDFAAYFRGEAGQDERIQRKSGLGQVISYAHLKVCFKKFSSPDWQNLSLRLIKSPRSIFQVLSPNVFSSEPSSWEFQVFWPGSRALGRPHLGRSVQSHSISINPATICIQKSKDTHRHRGAGDGQTGEHKMPISSCQMVIARSINAATATATATATTGLKFTYEDRNGHSSYLWPKSNQSQSHGYMAIEPWPNACMLIYIPYIHVWEVKCQAEHEGNLLRHKKAADRMDMDVDVGMGAVPPPEPPPALLRCRQN